MDNFCIMLRLTNRCNAECDYCSTDTKSTDYLTLLDLSESLNSLKIYMKNIGLVPEATEVTVCFLGGELTTLNINFLKKAKSLVEMSLSNFCSVLIGMQTNLIMSTDKIDDVYSLFNGNIGTSVDNFTESRRFKGSAKLYKETFDKNVSHLKNSGRNNIGACYVVSDEGIDNVEKEIELAEKNKYPLKLIMARQSYKGDAHFDFSNRLEEVKELYLSLLDEWFMKSNVPIDPFLYMLNRKLTQLGDTTLGCFESCNFTNTCHKQGVSIEPNGDFYFCQEMADLKSLRLGNLIVAEFDSKPIEVSQFRESNIGVTCSSCEHFVSCKGGCMAYSVDLGLGYSNKDPYCSMHYAIFSKIDQMIDQYGVSEVIKWKNSL